MSNSTVGAMAPPNGVVANFDMNGLTSVQSEFVLVYAITLGIATFAIAFRLYTRIRVIKSPDMDDVAATLALLLSAAFFGFCARNFKNGFGRHLWDTPAASLAGYAKILVPTVAVYLWAGSFTKFSILYMYHRINPNRHFRWALYAVAFVVFANSLITTVISTAGCAANVQTNAKCITDLALANAIINVITEFTIILIPIPMIHALHLPLRQKILLGFIFSGASFVIVVSIIRLTYVAALQHQVDTTWVEGITCMWSAFELNIGITCNCAIALKPFFRHYLPRLLNSASYGGESNEMPSYRNRFRNLNKRRPKERNREAYDLTNLETRVLGGPGTPPDALIKPPNIDRHFDVDQIQKSQIVVTNSYTIEGRDIDTESTENIIPQDMKDRNGKRNSRFKLRS